jgi:DNA-binding NtrC family response regulator
LQRQLTDCAGDPRRRRGTFRSDLFYRLNVFPNEMPSLRERREDIPLVEYFTDRFARQAGKSLQAVSKKSLEMLQSYPWPGNISEVAERD